MTRTDVHPATRRVTRWDFTTPNSFEATLRWCATHSEPVWEYNDGSYCCTFDLVTESSNAHDIVDGPWETP